MTGWPGQLATCARARGNVETLVGGFDEYVWRFELSGLVTGPGLHFHERAIERRRCHRDAASLLADDLFLEYVYAVLACWGTQRMDAPWARVTEFSLMAASLRSALPVIEDLWPLTVGTVRPESVPAVTRMLWRVISAIRTGTPEAALIAGTTALHHVLPDLVPPIDRLYTFRFFDGQRAAGAGDERMFREWFPYLVEIGHRCGTAIDGTLGRAGYMATSPAKVIDNAIIGFVQAHNGRPYE